MNHQWQRASLALGAVALSFLPGLVGPVSAQEITVDGTLDCGANTEEYCPIRDRIALITESLSGTRERVEIRVDWIKDAWIDSLPLQDDFYVLQIIPRPNGGYRAIGILDHLTKENLDSKRDPRDGRKESERRSNDGKDK